MNPSSRSCRPTFLAFAVLVGGVFASADALATERPSVPAAESLPASAASADDEAGEPTLPNAAAIDGAIDLSAHAGKVVYIDFWASWCVPCRAAFPWLNALQAELGDEGLVILGVNTGDTPEGAARFLEQVPADFPLLEDKTGSIAAAYGVGGMPVAFVHDREGTLIASHIGFDESYAEARAETLRAYVRRPR